MVDDAELDVVRRTVSCAAVLERMVGGWKLDARQSTRSALKYRHGAGEIIIINHDGRGWWNPLGSEKGDVFNLVQHLDPSLTFVQVCRRLRGFVGIAPSGPEAAEVHALAKADRTAAQRWAECTRLTTGDPAWSYLAGPRGLPAC
jgi:hypothetical protein